MGGLLRSECSKSRVTSCVSTGVAVSGSALARATGMALKQHWGTSENNRRAKYYELTKSGHKQFEVEKNTSVKLTC